MSKKPAKDEKKISEAEKVRRFAKRRKLDPEKVKEEMIKAEKRKQSYTMDLAEVEKNLLEYFDSLDPIVDPAKDKVLAWMRRPSYTEMMEMTPTEIKDAKDLENLPVKARKKLEDRQFDYMERLIEKPKNDAIWWKKHATPQFILLFQLRIVEMYKEMGVDVENFPEATGDLP